jgi:hypothetical protein
MNSIKDISRPGCGERAVSGDIIRRERKHRVAQSGRSGTVGTIGIKGTGIAGTKTLQTFSMHTPTITTTQFRRRDCGRDSTVLRFSPIISRRFIAVHSTEAVTDSVGQVVIDHRNDTSIDRIVITVGSIEGNRYKDGGIKRAILIEFAGRITFSGVTIRDRENF